jgi:ABC-type branched-subunit amino acid transport system substrate-binding protein
MNNKVKLSILSVGIISLFLLSLFSVPAFAAPTQDAKTLPAKINVCGVFPISARPDAGPDRRDGFLLAVDEINAQTGSSRILPDGVELVPIVKDDLNTAEGGTAAANSCVSDGADIVVGSSGSTVSAAMAAVLTPLKIIQISYASSSPSLTNRDDYPYFMRNVASDADQGLAVADLVAELGFTKGATINTDDTYGTGLVSHFTARFTSVGGNSIATAQTFTPGGTDVATEVQAIADATPEFVLLHAIDNDAKTVFKKAGELGIAGDSQDIVWIITDGSSTPATFSGDSDVKDAMQYVVGTNPAEAGTSKNAEFEALWNETTTCGDQDPCGYSRTSAKPNSYARFAYDAVYVVAMGLVDACDLTDSDATLAAMYDVEFVGAGGSVKFNAAGEVNGRFDFVQLVGETYSTWGTWEGSATVSVSSLTLANSQTVNFGTSSAFHAKLNAQAGPTQSATCTAASGAGAPGFELLFVVFSVGFVAIIRRRD